MDFIAVPLDVFVKYILIHLTFKDFMLFRCSSKSLCESYSQREIWKILYMRKKQIIFQNKELKKIRKLVWIDFKSSIYYHPGYGYARREVAPICSLIIKNSSDVDYEIRFVSTEGGCIRGTSFQGGILSGKSRVIKTWIGHTFEISRICNIRDNYEDSYKTIYYKVKKEDIESKPYHWVNSKGQDKISNNPITITLNGEKYDENVKEYIKLSHPFLSLRNFKNFKKEHKKLYIPEMRKKEKVNDRKNEELKKTIEHFQKELDVKKKELETIKKNKMTLDSFFER